MKRIIIFFQCFLMIWIGLVHTILYGQTYFKNPVITGMNPDPSICRVGDDYYLITSTFEYFPGLPIYHSKDLVHWKIINYVLSTPVNNPLMGAESSTGGQYAATIRYNEKDSTFYVTGTNYTKNVSKGVFFVKTKDIRGEWSEPYWLGLWNVDPSFYFEGDSAYLVIPDPPSGSFLLTTVDLKTGQLYKKPKFIAKQTGWGDHEGPHVYKVKGYYYLMNAEGGTGSGHMEVVHRSKSIWGPYEQSPYNPLISHKGVSETDFEAIGHSDIIETPDGWWLVCLGIRKIPDEKGGFFHYLGRETFLAPLKWNAEDWPIGAANGIVKEKIKAPKLPVHSWPKDSVRDDFDSNKIDLCWNFIRNPHPEDWSLTARPGFLRLNGSDKSFKEKDSPAFVCRRQTGYNIEMAAKIDFTPTASNEEAGLVIRGNDQNHYDLFVTYSEGKRVVMLRKYLKNKDQGTVYKEIPEGDIVLKITATKYEYCFWAGKEGGEMQLVGTASTQGISIKEIHGFTGAYVGMYASGNGKRNTNPADFYWVDYKDKD